MRDKGKQVADVREAMTHHMYELDKDQESRETASILREKVKAQNPEKIKFLREGKSKYSQFNDWLNLPTTTK